MSALEAAILSIVQKLANKPSPAPSGKTIITTSGNWVCPTGVTQIDVLIIGGGGGGEYGSGGNGSGGDGGGGGQVLRKVVAVTPGTSYPITIGAAGAGMPMGGGSSGGSAGGSTTAFGFTAVGGLRAGNQVTHQNGGHGAFSQQVGTGLAVATPAGDGGSGRFGYGGGGGGGDGKGSMGGSTNVSFGLPGSADAGGGGGGVSISGDCSGSNAYDFGGGGGGSGCGGTTYNGGNGFQGAVIIEVVA